MSFLAGIWAACVIGLFEASEAYIPFHFLEPHVSIDNVRKAAYFILSIFAFAPAYRVVPGDFIYADDALEARALVKLRRMASSVKRGLICLLGIALSYWVGSEFMRFVGT